VNWIELAEDRVKWRVIVNMIVYFSCHKKQKFLEQISDWQLLKENSAP
jgi:hypothetical protein